MFRNNWVKTAMLCLGLLATTSGMAWAQGDEKGLNCNQRNWNNDQATHCVMREQTIPAAGGVISVDGRTNGGVSVRGWDKPEILVRAQVQAWAKTDDEARALAEQVQVDIRGTVIRSEGPTSQGRDRKGWAVSFEVYVPHASDLSLKAHNGGISVRDVQGRIEFDTTNGGVSLARLAGTVRGTTTNGGINLTLDGTQWRGEGVDVRTTNGGVKVIMPANYSAHLESGTVNGGMTFDFPVTVQGKIDRELNTDIGSGGPPIRVRTTNGGVSIRRQ
jgi:DUF4097 and DUF4098 domain-containing protein YvlB